ncbi:ribonuclease H-like domain-containing protein [Tanacetum coccineum]
MSSMELWLVLDLGCSSFLQKIDLLVYTISLLMYLPNHKHRLVIVNTDATLGDILDSGLCNNTTIEQAKSDGGNSISEVEELDSFGQQFENFGQLPENLVNVRRFSRKSSSPAKYTDFVLDDKSMYGLKQASRKSNEKLVSVLPEIEFAQSKKHLSLFVKSKHVIIVNADDIVITQKNIDEVNKFNLFFSSKFLIKDLGNLKYFLGNEVMDTKSGLRLTQRKYCMDLLAEFGMLTRPITGGHVNLPKGPIKNTVDPRRLDFGEEDTEVRDNHMAKGKAVVDNDLKNPFKEATADPKDHLSLFASAANSGNGPCQYGVECSSKL